MSRSLTAHFPFITHSVLSHFFTNPTICFLLKHNRLFSGGNINCFNCLEFHTLCRCERRQRLFLQVVYISVVKHHQLSRHKLHFPLILKKPKTNPKHTHLPLQGFYAALLVLCGEFHILIPTKEISISNFIQLAAMLIHFQIIDPFHPKYNGFK